MSLESSIRKLENHDLEWTEPVHYKAVGGENAALDELLESGEVAIIHNPFEELKRDLYDLKNPAEKNNEALYKEFSENMAEQDLSYGEWVHFPWSKSVVRYPSEEDHRKLRTFRNQPLVRAEEQEVLNPASIAMFGMSVGSVIADQLVQSGIGSKYVLGDYDTLSPTNLNRVRATMSQVGLRKTVMEGRKISEVDPYIKQTHIHEGYTPLADEILDSFDLDIIIEEVDDLTAKARLRKYAAEHSIPLIMVTDLGEKAIIDVERHDIEEVKPFNGKLSQSHFEDVLAGDLTSKQKRSTLMKIAGIQHISPRMVEAAMQVDVSIGGLPQLSSAANVGASLAYTATREILLGRKSKSGSYPFSPNKVLKTQRPTTLREDLSTLNDFRRFLKE